jgi:hypothetical protein
LVQGVKRQLVECVCEGNVFDGVAIQSSALRDRETQLLQVPAKLLEGLLLSRVSGLVADPRGVHLANCMIIGSLDLTRAAMQPEQVDRAVLPLGVTGYFSATNLADQGAAPDALEAAAAPTEAQARSRGFGPVPFAHILIGADNSKISGGVDPRCVGGQAGDRHGAPAVLMGNFDNADIFGDFRAIGTRFAPTAPEDGNRHLGPWHSLGELELTTLEWVDGFNNRRLLEPFGHIPPAEAEEKSFELDDQAAMAA